MTEIKFTIEYGDKKRSWVFKDPTKFEKEVKKILSMMIFANAVANTEIGKLLMELSDKMSEKRQRRVKHKHKGSKLENSGCG